MPDVAGGISAAGSAPPKNPRPSHAPGTHGWKPGNTAGWEACRYQRHSALVTGCSSFGILVEKSPSLSDGHPFADFIICPQTGRRLVGKQYITGIGRQTLTYGRFNVSINLGPVCHAGGKTTTGEGSWVVF
jgi:hypothetical protein